MKQNKNIKAYTELNKMAPNAIIKSAPKSDDVNNSNPY